MELPPLRFVVYSRNEVGDGEEIEREGEIQIINVSCPV